MEKAFTPPDYVRTVRRIDPDFSVMNSFFYKEILEANPFPSTFIVFAGARPSRWRLTGAAVVDNSFHVVPHS